MEHPRPGPPRRRPAVWQLLAAIVGIALLLCPVLRAVHFVAVRHVTCPYDGELIHEDELPQGVHEAPEASGPAPVSVLPPHHHDDCRSLALSLRSVLVAARAFRAPPPPAARSLALLSAAEDEFGRSVLSYAPKLPPPA